MTQPSYDPSASTSPTSFGNRRQSRQPRRFVRMSAWMIFYRHGLQKHVSLVRDINRNGIYFYSNFTPESGTDIEFVMKFPTWTHLAVVACKGQVMRVEQPKPGTAIGVAVKLSRFWALQDNILASQGDTRFRQGFPG